MKEKIEYFKRIFENDKLIFKWFRKLEDVINEFFNQRKNKNYENEDFWNQVLKKAKGYYPTKNLYQLIEDYFPIEYINGWILSFFLYNSKGKFMVESLEEIPLKRPSMDENSNFIKEMMFELGTKIEFIPHSQWSAPVVIEFLTLHKPPVAITVISGFSSVLKENNVYRPQTCLTFQERPLIDDEKEEVLRKKLNLKKMGVDDR